MAGGRRIIGPAPEGKRKPGSTRGAPRVARKARASVARPWGHSSRPTSPLWPHRVTLKDVLRLVASGESIRWPVGAQGGPGTGAAATRAGWPHELQWLSTQGLAINASRPPDA